MRDKSGVGILVESQIDGPGGAEIGLECLHRQIPGVYTTHDFGACRLGAPGAPSAATKKVKSSQFHCLLLLGYERLAHSFNFTV